MIGKQKVIAIIPARGGSKRLPRKNVLNLAGKPLISWTIDAAKECKYIDEILVSTDDREISNIALQH
ncbi:cytidylyltransferase domain-containing protein, partial [Vibrio parahaemolyticus]